MTQYVLKRLLLFFPTILIVSIIVFSLIRLLPGDIVTLMFEQNQYAADMEAMRVKLGLDKPIYEQYISWMGRMLRGDFGASLWTKRTALEDIALRAPVSLELGLLALSISLAIAIPVGVLSAIRQDTIFDYIARSAAIGLLSIPSFWLATVVIVLPSLWFKWAPPSFTSFGDDPLKNLGQFIVPALIMGSSSAAAVMRMTRAMMLEVLRQDYVRTAWAKGLRERGVIFRHALQNAMVPVITIIGLQIPTIIAGSVIMEQIFGLPGMGRFMLDNIVKRDYPMLQVMNLFFATVILVTNLLVDLAYGVLDPRIRFK